MGFSSCSEYFRRDRRPRDQPAEELTSKKAWTKKNPDKEKPDFSLMRVIKLVVVIQGNYDRLLCPLRDRSQGPTCGETRVNGLGSFHDEGTFWEG